MIPADFDTDNTDIDVAAAIVPIFYKAVFKIKLLVVPFQEVVGNLFLIMIINIRIMIIAIVIIIPT